MVSVTTYGAVGLSLFNFMLWYMIGKWTVIKTYRKCLNVVSFSERCTDKQCLTAMNKDAPKLKPLLTKGFMNYKLDSLVDIPYPEWSILMQPKQHERCTKIVNPHIPRRREGLCLAVVSAYADATYNLLRIESNFERDAVPELDVGMQNITGFFNNVANENGRNKLAYKMGKLLTNLDPLEKYVVDRLHQRSLFTGDDVVVMVVNAGEMDLLANFACSCKAHNISMHNVMVFAGSSDVIPLIESFGAMGIYHNETFADVSRNASFEYLDRIFIDMMWYKSFSVWLLLKMRYNVLFQDVDLVWYRDPIQYFRTAHTKLTAIKTRSNNDVDQPDSVTERITDGLLTLAHNSANNLNTLTDNIILNSKSIFRADSSGSGHSSSGSDHSEEVVAEVDAASWGQQLNALPPADAYLSDDGQRSQRYAPFFANSGFYYLVANPRTVYFAWTILTAFDLLHRTGSHQNVFTIRLIESLDLANLRPKLLSLREFPSGVKFNHDHPYMRAIQDRHEHPFVFHMCWTRNKYDKLRNFRLSSMWFVTEPRSAELGELGRLDGESGAEELKALAAQLWEMEDNSLRHKDDSDSTAAAARWNIMAAQVCNTQT